jgi:PAS domain S-box-containing protein
VKNSNVVGRAYGEFHSPEETKDFSQKVEKVFKTGKSLSYEYRSQRDKRYFIRTLSPVKALEDGTPTAATVISKDITDLKLAEETLREREAFNFALFHYNPVETIVVDRDGSVIGFNLAKEKSGDRLPAIGDVMFKDYAGKHEIDMRAELMACIKSGKVEAFPERRYGDKYLSITISPFSQGALIISEDITERKRAAELLHRERDTFLSVLKKAPYGVVLIDKDEKGILCNSEFTNITGYTLKDVATIKDWLRLAYPDKKYRDIVIHTLRGDEVEADSAKLYQNKFQRAFFRTFTVTCKEGTVKEIEFRPTVLEDGSTIIMFADITEKKRMHDLLEAAATEWRATFDAIGDAVCLLDQQGRIKRCNNAMLGMLARPFSEIVDLTCWEILHGVSRLPKEYPIARMQKTLHRETDVFLKDNHWFNVSVDPLLDGEGNVVGAVHIMSDITDRMLAAEELQNSREQLRNLSTYLESVREQERTVIAREIHDELAQTLTALKMDLSWLDNRLPQDQKPLSAKTKSMHSLIDTTIKTVKRISAELRPGILDDLGLVAAIEWQAEEFQDRTGITCHVTVEPGDLTVDQDRSTAIFRIFQETLTNIARHARATKVAVGLTKRARRLTLRVKDNGIGITEEQIADSKSFGLIGMRERVYPWGGNVSVTGTSGKGTRVLVSVPIENEKGEK